MTTTRTVRPQNPWRTAVAAGAVSYIDSGALITTGVAFVLYEQQLGIDSNTVGALQGILTITLAIGAVIGGRLGDRIGRRRVFTATIMLYIVGIALLAAAVAPAMLFLGVLIVGLGIGADLPVSLSLVNEEAPVGRKGRMIAFTVFLWFIGIAVPNLLTGVLGALGPALPRVLFGQLLVVAIVVLLLRLGVRESVEWSAARTAQQQVQGAVRFHAVGQLFRAPLNRTVAGLSVFYTLWGLGANTIGAFGFVLFVSVAHGSAQSYALANLIGLPIGVVLGIVLMRIADRPTRRVWVTVAGAVNVVAFALPLLLGFNTGSLIACTVTFGASAAFFGESIYKIWLQEMLPTLLRGTAQGFTLTVQRVVVGAVAFGTPALAFANPYALFGILCVAQAIAFVIALLWIPRLPSAVDLEAPPVLVEDGAADHAPAPSAAPSGV